MITTTAPITVAISSELDIANARNVARLSARALAFPVSDQARIGWAVADLARTMLMLSIRDMMIISHVQRDDVWGIRVQCLGEWLRMVNHSWAEKKTRVGFGQWVEDVRFEGNPRQLILDLWPTEALDNQ